MKDRKLMAKRERQRKRRAQKSKVTAKPTQERKPILISASVLARAQQKKRRGQKREVNAFVLPTFPPGVAPSKDSGLAMDEDLNLGGALAWAEGSSLFSDNLQFLGYPYLAELAQRPEYRMVSERLAIEMTRKWIKFQSINTEEDKTAQIKELNDAFTKFKVSDKFLTLAEQDGFFGRSHLFADIGDQNDKEELKTSIGDGTTKLSQQKVKKGSLKRLTVVEPVWCYPTNYNSNNPIDPTWYNPEHWLMMGTQVHSTRLLRFVGRDIPDMLKPAYAFGGLSMSQMIKPYVDKWLRNVNSVSDLIDMFSITCLSTDLNAQLSGTSENFFNRMDLFNAMRDNRGLFAVDKNNEALTNLSTPLSTLDTLQAASLEHIAAVAHLPLIIMLGIQPAGLNASSEGEIRAFYDWVNAFQIKFFGPGLTRVMHIIMLHLWGKIDPGITYSFEPLWSVDEVQLATKRKAEADTDVAYVEGGILSEEEVRKRIASDPSTPYQGLDVSDVPEPVEEEGAGDEPPMPGEESDEEASGEERVIPFGGKKTANDADNFEEGKHPRANNGQFGSGGGGASAKSAEPLDPASMSKVGKQMGSNPGGVYADKAGKKFYVKQGKSVDHVNNELAAADLYALAGSPTLSYRPVKGGKYIATEMRKLDKDNASKLSEPERKKAQQDFVTHAWLANWDAVGLGGDNVGTVDGVPTSLDLGGALAYRAQGAPKGGAFSDKVGELDTLRDKGVNRDSARMYGDMTDAELSKSAQKVTSIPDDKIRAIIKERSLPVAMADRLIARKKDIAQRFGIAQDEAGFEESKHPRNHGKFAPKGGGSSGSSEEAHPDKTAKSSSQVPFVDLRTKLKALIASGTGTPQLHEQKESLSRQLVHGYVLKIKELLKSGKQTSAEKASKKALKYSKHLPYKERNEVKTSLAATLKGEAAPELVKSAPAHPITSAPVQPKPATPAAAVSSSIEAKAKELFEKQYAAKGYKWENAPESAKKKWTEIVKEKKDPSKALTDYVATLPEDHRESFIDLANKTSLKSAQASYDIGKSKIDANSKKYGTLNPADAAHILAYSGNSYVDTNQALRAGVMNEAQWGHVRSLNKALDKLPDHTGTVYRKAGLDAETAKLYQPGMIVEERGFTSTSKSSEKWHGNIHFEITSKTGKDISGMSHHQAEQEVLFQSGSRFKIVSRSGGTIKMEQVE